MSDDRMQWTFERHISQENRSPRALEYIAYYLDRIDQNLERIARGVEFGNGQTLNVAGHLQNITEALNTRR